jgi:hypothetical protein
MRDSAYIRWAKSREGFRYNLGRSSIRQCPAGDLAARTTDFAIAGDNAHGWEPLRRALGARYGVHRDRIVLAIGTSMANHLVCAALLGEPGHVLVESPGYEPLQSLPAYFGAEVETFPRRAAANWALEVDAIAERLRPGQTRLVVLSDLHNPTGQRAQPKALERLARLADANDFHVLVDEVYLEFIAEPTIAATRSPRFVSTCSLTKAYGLDGLRAGWIVASEDLATRIRALNDLFGIIMPHPTERLACRALQRLDVIGAGARRLVDSNRTRALDFVARRSELEWVEPRIGPVGFVRLSGASVDDLVEILERDFDATLPPGRFFGANDHFRLAFGMERADLEAGLDRLNLALDRI